MLGDEEDEETSHTFGTHVDLESSINFAKNIDVELLDGFEEIKYEDFSYLTTNDVNKLSGTGWKDKKKQSPRRQTENKSLYEESSLASVFNLEDAFKRFDLDKNGRLDEREQAALFRTVEREMLAELKELHARGDHRGADSLNKRLRTLRGELEGLQRDWEASQQAEQRSKLAAGASSMQHSLKTKQAEHLKDIQNRFKASEDDLRNRHQIELENLEGELRRERMPPMIHSKKFMELKSTERQLAAGHVYKDAATVAKTVEAMRGPEEAQFYDNFYKSQDIRRQQLLKRQSEEMNLLKQKNLVRGTHDRCAREEQEFINKKRLHIHQSKMAHQHLLENRLKVELYDPPSMLRTKRPGYQSTSASLRGSQIEGVVVRGGIASHDTRGRFATSTLKFLEPSFNVHKPPPPAKLHGPEMPNLTDKHDFFQPMMSTTTSEWKTAAMLHRDERK